MADQFHAGVYNQFRGTHRTNRNAARRNEAQTTQDSPRKPLTVKIIKRSTAQTDAPAPVVVIDEPQPVTPARRVSDEQRDLFTATANAFARMVNDVRARHQQTAAEAQRALVAARAR